MSQPQHIIISGIDGSGKTTVIEGIQQELHLHGISTCYVWLRYNHILVKPVHAFCRLVGLSRKKLNGEGKLVWHHEFYRCHSFCSLYIFLTYLDTLFSRLKMRRTAAIAPADIVICDRWVYDILIDLAVDTRRPGLLYGAWLQRFKDLLPQNTRQYLIKRDTKCLLDVRPEYNRDREFLLRARIYRRLEAQPGITVIDNNRSIGDAIASILDDLAKNQQLKIVEM